MHDWDIELSTVWNVLGPFPIGAREQHFLSPSYPLDLSASYVHEPSRTWPSALADGGEVGWRFADLSADGRMLISHPHIRWDVLRATEGWAALQHHNVLRGTLKITPPQGASLDSIPWLITSFKQISFFALLPEDADPSHILEWHPGDIYAFKHSPKQLIELSNVSLYNPTTFQIFISGDYEIRLFGDPKAFGRKIPVLDLGINISLEYREQGIISDPNLHVICDFVEGWAFGTVLGLGIHSSGEDWEVTGVQTASASFSLTLLHERERLVASQTRIIPVLLNQKAPYLGKNLAIELAITNRRDLSYSSIKILLQLSHREFWDNTTNAGGITASYLLNGIPTSYIAVPPQLPNGVIPRPAVLALHGAGVDISDSFWPSSLPQQQHSWIICPSGLTSWGLDWHGPSADDAWGSLSAVQSLLEQRAEWSLWSPQREGPVMVIGHSNGGQGTWYIASRYPDRVFAAIPAAAYIKSQQYISLSLSHGSHFIDPALHAVFAAALTPDDNDIFLSNAVDTSILAIHGGADENVPTWHSRELVSLVKTWRPDANISFLEDKDQPHWYPTVFLSEPVQNFFSQHLDTANSLDKLVFSNPFTLTVATPSDSGSFHGFSIRQNTVPGRLSKLNVIPTGDSLTIRTNNVHIFSFNPRNIHHLSVDNTDLVLLNVVEPEIWLQKEEDGWKVSHQPPLIRQFGPMTRLLRSKKPLLVVYPTNDSHSLSIARRIAHALLLYFRVDATIVTDDEAIRISLESVAEKQNLIIIGSRNQVGSKLLQLGSGLVALRPHEFVVNNVTFSEPSLGIAFIHPFSIEPYHNCTVLFLSGTDASGLERVARLFLPIRSGVPLPEFLILSKDTDFMATGGVVGAGFWGRQGEWSDTMAWLTQPLKR
ncbi:hypothetical protein M422DRAFT_214788 [Sphaerobolus stellatus SS14]|uniref:Peptidase S9 prolyl oligopeptidase catalytic domain-containing protein n=1 Tax=Sphaerobolus stellatus (strain SS14) TaxID=990650 RepID=A0A0C9TJS6_SPHS4|nr:hypothetical protein M422DRAFT_214788 [Sphaerobolus stellatus SS14]